MTPSASHEPVLLRETLEHLAPAPGEVILDGTIGLAGHAAEILRRLLPDGVLLGMDRDAVALELAATKLRAVEGRFELHHAPFAQIRSSLVASGRTPEGSLDGILLDLGVSSMQIDLAERGFSFQKDGPLDMRMDPSTGAPVSSWLATVSADELTRVLREYGEERDARRITRAIERARMVSPIQTTRQLARIIEGCVPARSARNSRIHPATRSFQALRISINGELDQLREFLRDIDRFVRPNGRIVVLSYHSLEDRIVKEAFAEGLREGLYREVTRTPVRPGEAEIERNPRARSARLRCAIRA